MRVRLIILCVHTVLIFSACKSKSTIKYAYEQKTQAFDTSFVGTVSVDGICPCKTTLTDVRRSAQTSITVPVNMDLGKRCDGKTDDSRFDNEAYLIGSKGMILQLAEGSDYIAKIHLTKDFTGHLPNGEYVSVKTLKLKEVVKMHPSFQFNTSDCSDHWSYNNGSIYFYVAIDSAIKRYPLDEKFYEEKPIDGIDIVLWCYRLYAPKTVGDISYERPLYAPLSETHLNSYATKVHGYFSKTGSLEIIKLGKWLEYSADHQLITEEYYDSTGKMINKIR